jgi:hypothetical protein
MTQCLHFLKIQCFTEQFTQSIEFSDILQMLKVLLENKNSSQIEDLLCAETVNTEFLSISASEPQIGEILSTGSQIQLHKDSGYYLVNKELWESIKDIIIEQSIKEFEELNKSANSKGKKSKSSADSSNNDFHKIYEDYFKDLGLLETWYNKKMLIVEVS